VRFYFRATVARVQESLSLGSMYLLVDDAIEEYSRGALNVYKHEGEDSLVVIRLWRWYRLSRRMRVNVLL